MAAMARHDPRFGSHDHRGEGQPAQREGHQPVQDHRLEEVIGADIAGLGRQEQPHRGQPDRGPSSGQIARASRSTPRQVAPKVRTKTRNSPADSPSGRVTRSRTKSEPRCGLNASNARTNGSSA